MKREGRTMLLPCCLFIFSNQIFLRKPHRRGTEKKKKNVFSKLLLLLSQNLLANEEGYVQMNQKESGDRVCPCLKFKSSSGSEIHEPDQCLNTSSTRGFVHGIPTANTLTSRRWPRTPSVTI
jgi:hypothetical protein